jgi:hypothetical protein
MWIDPKVFGVDYAPHTPPQQGLVTKEYSIYVSIDT